MRSAETLVLWVIFVVVFTGLFLAFSGRGPAPTPPVPDCAPSFWDSVVNWLGLVVLGGAFVLWLRWQRRRYQKQHEGVSRLNEGRYLEALTLFERDRAKDPKDPSHVFNCGVAALMLWRVDAAIRDLEGARAMKGPGQGQIAVLSFEQLPLAYALAGRPGDALSLAKTAPPEANRPRLRLAEGIALLRQGDPAGARTYG